jgi:peptide/nickel transport system substrate-binding protein
MVDNEVNVDKIKAVNKPGFLNKRNVIIIAVLLLIAGTVIFLINNEPEIESEVIIETVGGEVSAEELERQQTLIFVAESDEDILHNNWNIFKLTKSLGGGFRNVLVEPLFVLNYESGEIMPWLATDYSEDGKEWTITLRDGVTWSDGEAFNADDVVFTVETMMEPNLVPLAHGAIHLVLDDVEKIDDLTVKFYLKEEDPYFLHNYVLSKIQHGLFVLPEHIWNGQDIDTFQTDIDLTEVTPVFTGAYKPVEATPGEEIIFERDDNWWGAKSGWKPLPEPRTLKIIYLPQEEAVRALGNNEVDNLIDSTLSEVVWLKQNNKNIVTWFEDLPYAWVPDPCSRIFEINNAIEPWNDKDMRWALNYAIDRDEIVAFAYEGTTLKSRHFFPAYPPLNFYTDLLEEKGLYDTYPVLEHNPAKAKGLIESKGYVLNSDGYYEKDGNVLGLSISTHNHRPELELVTDSIVEQLNSVGVKAEKVLMEGDDYRADFNKGITESRMGWYACGSIVEPFISMDLFNVKWLKEIGEDSEGNEWRWSGENAEKYSEIVDEISRHEMGSPEVDDLFVEAMGYWLEDLPIIPITQAKKGLVSSSKYWKNWPTLENNYIQPPTWWMSTQVIIHNLESTTEEE